MAGTSSSAYRPIEAQTKVTIVGKNEIYNRENLVRPFLVHQVLGPKPPPPLPPPCSKEALPPAPLPSNAPRAPQVVWNVPTQHRIRSLSASLNLFDAQLLLRSEELVAATGMALADVLAALLPMAKVRPRPFVDAVVLGGGWVGGGRIARPMRLLQA